MLFLTWNILFPDEKWIYRLQLIRIYLLTLKPDIIFLQEVRLETFEMDFDFLLEYNYVRHEQNKKRTNKMGNVILFKREFREIQTIRRTKAIHCELEQLDTGKHLYLSNVHLSAGLKSQVEERKKEMVRVIDVWYHCDPIIIAGDFNQPNVSDFNCHLNTLSPHPTFRINNELWCFDHVLTNLQQIHICNSINIKKESIPNDHYPSFEKKLMHGKCACNKKYTTWCHACDKPLCDSCKHELNVDELELCEHFCQSCATCIVNRTSLCLKCETWTAMKCMICYQKWECDNCNDNAPCCSKEKKTKTIKKQKKKHEIGLHTQKL